MNWEGRKTNILAVDEVVMPHTDGFCCDCCCWFIRLTVCLIDCCFVCVVVVIVLVSSVCVCLFNPYCCFSFLVPNSNTTRALLLSRFPCEKAVARFW